MFCPSNVLDKFAIDEPDCGFPDFEEKGLKKQAQANRRQQRTSREDSLRG
jgi:hypothetical protein